MKIDYYLEDCPLGAVAEQAARAGAIGFDGIFTADTSHDPFLRVMAATSAAPDVEVGTSVAVAFARSPMVVAQTAWDLASLTGGRFLLGLGTQVKPHIERRFSMSWDRPAERMAEFIGSLRAIWDTWQNGTRLRFRGEHYSFSLMTPFFDPGAIARPDVPVHIAGVGPRMSRLAGEMCDGYHVHPFHTVRYLREVTLPAMRAGARAAGRSLDQVEMVSSVMVVTGRDESQIEESRLGVRRQIAFYASTPAYSRVLDAHGWDFGPALATLARRGRWGEMADLIPDEVVAEIAVEAPVNQLGSAISARYEGVLDRVGCYSMGDAISSITDEEWATVLAQVRG
ncbi:MAG: TIGR03617 family F420-dependent LLM class oxidoreductase [Acidimicrobiia bacterium]|nr:TIGR03617 family F420-dependent LLM class oxidoreductase [Acidimicrobiia bacterium]MYC85983.1 TIGR03617 family F420-dependent LLM class oxidoreductase [Acidimicrobiia bacterium]